MRNMHARWTSPDRPVRGGCYSPTCTHSRLVSTNPQHKSTRIATPFSAPNICLRSPRRPYTTVSPNPNPHPTRSCADVNRTPTTCLPNNSAPMPAPEHRQHSSISPCTTFLILCGFLLALFPSLFVAITWSPWYYFFPAPPPSTPPVVCHAPNRCVAPDIMSWYTYPHVAWAPLRNCTAPAVSLSLPAIAG